MPKNIVLCCDGTDNQFSGDHTNVIRAYKVAVRSAGQVIYYDPGVGTMPEPWAEGRWAKEWSILKGLAFGSGFSQNVADAYRFLMDTYEAGDQIYLFGFSRGAFTVRALAGMLHAIGLLYPDTENLIPYAQRYWRKDHHEGKATQTPSPGQLLCAEFKKTLSRSCPIHFIGVWDTVSSVGFINQWKVFPFTQKNPEVKHVRHAVSLDERRCFFRQNLMFRWQDSPNGTVGNAPAVQDIKNVWFAGVHSDVGGGYPPAEAGLAKITFQWMMREAGLFGLQIDPVALQREIYEIGEPPNPCATRHESLQGLWRLAEYIPVKRYDWNTGQYRWSLPLGQPRDVEDHAKLPEVFVHQSVIDRFKCRPDYCPPNIPHTEAELRKFFDGKVEV